MNKQTFATKYCDTYLRKGSRSLVLQAEGKSQRWHTELHDTKRTLRICRGWTSFARDNNLRERDICLFELMENEGEQKKMMVYIILAFCMLLMGLFAAFVIWK